MIAHFFDSSFNLQWSWKQFLNDELACSGTDSVNLALAAHMLKQNANYYFFSNVKGSSSEYSNHYFAENLSDAIKQAVEKGCKIILFNDKKNEATIKGLVDANQINLGCIVWVQNDPSPYLADFDCIKRIICVTAKYANNFRHKAYFKKIEVIHNFIETSSYLPANSKLPYSVAFLGSITLDKGFHHLIKIWPSIKEKYKEAVLHVYGSAKLYNNNYHLGPLGIAFQDYEEKYLIPYIGNSVEEAKEKYGISFLGLTTPQLIKKSLGKYLIGVVNPNCKDSFETFCISAIEFQAAGTAVIGANRMGLKETIQQKHTGLLINKEQELQGAIEALFSHPEQAQKLGVQGINFVKHQFSMGKVLRDWETLFTAVLNGNKTQTPHFEFFNASVKDYFKYIIGIIKYKNF